MFLRIILSYIADVRWLFLISSLLNRVLYPHFVLFSSDVWRQHARRPLKEHVLVLELILNMLLQWSMKHGLGWTCWRVRLSSRYFKLQGLWRNDSYRLISDKVLTYFAIQGQEWLTGKYLKFVKTPHSMHCHVGQIAYCYNIHDTWSQKWNFAIIIHFVC